MDRLEYTLSCGFVKVCVTKMGVTLHTTSPSFLSRARPDAVGRAYFRIWKTSCVNGDSFSASSKYRQNFQITRQMKFHISDCLYDIVALCIFTACLLLVESLSLSDTF